MLDIIKEALNSYKGVIHIGANLGQERDVYKNSDATVIWFEPNPEIFAQLQTNIAPYSKQKAYQYLISNQDGATYPFHISCNEGQSSSIFELAKHKEVWPNVFYNQSIEVKGITLDSFMKQENLNPADFQILMVDTQGADLLVLEGAKNTLRYMKYVEVEVSSMELYKGGCVDKEVGDFLNAQGFVEKVRCPFIYREGGTCAEVVWGR